MCIYDSDDYIDINTKSIVDAIMMYKCDYDNEVL